MNRILKRYKIKKYFKDNFNFKNHLPKIANFVLLIFLGIAGITFATTVGTNILTTDLTAGGNAVITGNLDLTGLATFSGGVDISGGTIDNTVIGGTIAAAGSFTTLRASGDIGVGIDGDTNDPQINFLSDATTDARIEYYGNEIDAWHLNGNVTYCSVFSNPVGMFDYTVECPNNMHSSSFIGVSGTENDQSLRGASILVTKNCTAGICATDGISSGQNAGIYGVYNWVAGKTLSLMSAGEFWWNGSSGNSVAGTTTATKVTALSALATNNNANNTITAMSGIKVKSNTNIGTVTSNYGILLHDQGAVGTTNYGLYGEAMTNTSGTNYFMLYDHATQPVYITATGFLGLGKIPVAPLTVHANGQLATWFTTNNAGNNANIVWMETDSDGTPKLSGFGMTGTAGGFRIEGGEEGLTDGFADFIVGANGDVNMTGRGVTRTISKNTEGASTTLTADEITGYLTEITGGTVTLTLPSADVIEDGMDFCEVGTSLNFYIWNESGNIFTLAQDTGAKITMHGALTLATGLGQEYMIRFTSCTEDFETADLYVK